MAAMVDDTSDNTVVINGGAVKKKKRTHLMGIDTLDRETDHLRCYEKLGVLEVMATSSSLTGDGC